MAALFFRAEAGPVNHANLPDTLTIGFIGAGNMAGALLKGLRAQGVAGQRLWASDINPAALANLASSLAIQSADSATVAAAADVLVLAVKPQVMAAACAEIRNTVKPGALVISIAAGIPLASLRQWLGAEVTLVRCMPNTPALVGQGATGLYADPDVAPAQRDLADAILGAVGITLWVPAEADLDAVTALSGSGPAYFFLFIEALEAAGAALGLDPRTAGQLARQTALGAATLANTATAPVAELRRQVTSPGGTTERAIGVFEAGELRALVDAALRAARDRAVELAGGTPTDRRS